MVKLQSCNNGLVNASVLSSIEHEVAVNEDSGVIGAIAELSAELKRERDINAELKQRISMLEAQLLERDNHQCVQINDGQQNCPVAANRSTKKLKTQKTASLNNNGHKEIENEAKVEPNKFVTWMCMDIARFSSTSGLKENDFTDDYETDTDDSAEEVEDHEHTDTSYKAPNKMDIRRREDYQNGSRIALFDTKKDGKVAFCPKEVKRIMESEQLLLKNAQSHTMRKVIVFASLGTRHGCDDLYELDFNHFSIQRRGQPYVSPTDPGEHVLYENPGVRKKIFYPNPKNATLCPVQILEEEKSMRANNPSCPSFLFLCIKYGGRTRNLPQNEYVRQRMGRNKLKSFGPLMCEMAKLVNVRDGSFFFKALGITILFMAGFPNDVVRRETKYGSLDLLRKYYRTDKKAEGEELFHSNLACDNPESPGSVKLTRKTTSSTKLKGNKQEAVVNKPPYLPRPSIIHFSDPSSSANPSKFGLTGYNPSVSNQATNVTYYNQTPYQIFQPPLPPNTFMPMIYYWPALSTMNGYRPPSAPASTNPNISMIHPHQCYNIFSVEKSKNNLMNLEEADTDSDSSSTT